MKFEHRPVLELVQTQIISASPSHAPSHRYHFCLAKNTALSVLMPEMRSYPKKCPCTRCSSGLEVTPLPGWLLICLLTPGCALAWGDLGSIHEWQSSAQGWGWLYLASTERNGPTQELSWECLFPDLLPHLLSLPPLLGRPLLSPIQLFQHLNSFYNLIPEPGQALSGC